MALPFVHIETPILCTDISLREKEALKRTKMDLISGY